ncbi:hypothetical protein [Nannocystis radixulma]|uniref:Uncharacterized protein n=1 Tax=Nannocystis radixulma TaxID=2995305 RepID=A0ABT5BPG6_9BACT|nr:hypothetical protein [Nannocystis radixulma]MDC0675588.1 hypothetical protein [Nannocystis radixulma]
MNMLLRTWMVNRNATARIIVWLLEHVRSTRSDEACTVRRAAQRTITVGAHELELALHLTLTLA